MNAGAIRAGKAFVELNADNSKFSKALKIAENRLKHFGSNVQQIGMSVMRAGLIGAAPLAASTKVFATFDDQMRLVKAVTQSTGKDFEMLTEEAKRLGRTTSYTASEVAEAMGELGRLGFNPAEIKQSMQAILDLARGTQTPLFDSAQIAASAMRAYNLEASRMTDVADILLATANASAANVIDIGEAFKYAAPIAYEFGMSLRDTSKAIATMSQFAIRGSLAGTTLRNIMLRMSNKSVLKKLKFELGVDVGDAAGNLRPIGDILTDIGKGLSKVTEVKKISLMQEIFGIRAVAGGAKLLSANFDSINNAIDNYQGIARKTAQEMDSGIGGAFRRLRNSVEGIGIAIGDAMAKPILLVATRIKEVNGEIIEWVKNNNEIIRVVGGGVAGLLATASGLMAIGVTFKLIGMGLAAIAMPMKAVIGTVKLLSAAALLLANPFILAGAAIAVTGAVILTATGKAKNAIDYLGETVSGLKDRFVGTFDYIAEYLKSGGSIETAVQMLALRIRIAFTKSLNSIADKITDFVGSAKIAWQMLQGQLVQVMLRLDQFFFNAWEDIKVGFYKMVLGIREVWAKMTDFLAEKMGWALEKIIKSAKSFGIIWEKIQEHKFNPARAFFEAKAEIEKTMKDDTFMEEFKKQLEIDRNDRIKELENKIMAAEEAKAAKQSEYVSKASYDEDEKVFHEIARKMQADKDARDAYLKDLRDQLSSLKAGMDAVVEKAEAEKKKKPDARRDANERVQKAQENLQWKRLDLQMRKALSDEELEEIKRMKESGASREEIQEKVDERRKKDLEAQQAYKAAQQELQKAMGERAGLRRGSKRNADGERKHLSFQDFLMNRLGIEPAAMNLGKATAAGSFSGYGRFGAQGDTTGERTMKAVEEIAKNTRDLLNETVEANEGTV